MAQDNSGISITGGTVNAGAMAAGSGAAATNIVQGAPPQSIDELRTAMAELIEALQADPASMNDPSTTLEAAESLQHELEEPKPRKERLLGLLRSVSSGVGSVASLTTALATIEQAIHILL